MRTCNTPSLMLACSMSSNGSDRNIAVIHLCFPLLCGHKTTLVVKVVNYSTGLSRRLTLGIQTTMSFGRDVGLFSGNWILVLLCVGLEQDLVFELLAFTKLEVKYETWDAVKLLTEVLHLQLPDLRMHKHHELQGAANRERTAGFTTVYWVHIQTMLYHAQPDYTY